MKGRDGMQGKRIYSFGAFTLIELLTVIGIIGILAGLVISGISAARKKANQIRCLSNLRQVGVAIIAYVNDNKDMLPYNYLVSATPKYTYIGEKSLTLGHHLASYLDQRRPEDLGSEEGIFIFLQCPQRLAVHPQDTGTHFALQHTMTGSRTYSNGTNRPFGTKDIGPIRYGELQDFGGPSRVWAIIEADQDIESLSSDFVTWFNDLPPSPVHGGSRSILFFDGRVQLLKDQPPKPE